MRQADRRSARERLREERLRQAARERLRRRLLTVAAPVLVIALVVAAGIAVQALRSRESEFAGKVPPAAALGDGSIRFAADKVTDTTPVVEVYEDFQCPACREFERINGGTLRELAATGAAVVIYHPVAIIDQRSVRSGSAAQCAAEGGKFLPYHDVLFQNQPPEQGGQGFTVEELVEYGTEVGLDGDAFAECVRSVQHRQDLLQRTQAISTAYRQRSGKGFGTPTVYLNGRPLPPPALFSVDAFEEAVREARGPARTNAPVATRTPANRTETASGSEE